MNRLGLEQLTLLEASPPEFVRIAAAAGCGYVSFFLGPRGPGGMPLPYSLIDDQRLRRETAKCLHDEGVSIGLIDGFHVFPDLAASRHRRAFEALAELAVTRINATSFEPDRGRALNELSILATMAAEYEVTVTLESCPVLELPTLVEARRMIDAIGLANVKLLVDTMHVSRSGEAEAVSTLPAGLVDYVQICDGPLAMPATAEEYMDEAVNGRLIPGEGEMPLAAMLRHIDPEIIVSAEVPLRRRSAASLSDLDLARLVVDGTRRVLAAR